MNIADMVLVSVIGVSAVLGLMRGFIGAVASILAWILAGWAAFRHGAEVALVLSGGSPPTAAELFGGYALSFLVVLLFVGLVGTLVRLLARTVGLSGIDRAFGLLLGAARGVLVACVMIVLAGFTALPQDPDWQRSGVVQALLPGAIWLGGWLPEAARGELDLSGFGNGPAPEDNGAGETAPTGLE